MKLYEKKYALTPLWFCLLHGWTISKAIWDSRVYPLKKFAEIKLDSKLEFRSRGAYS